MVRDPLRRRHRLALPQGPLLLGSAWGLVAGVALVGLLMTRIGGEEKVLVRDLDGYEAYRGKVRYRLVPHVW
jgi:protein-S-isoprenylcysteine O-methyltransferase Ste14